MEDMSLSEFIKENFDVPTLLRQMQHAEICVDGIGGSVSLPVYSEDDSTIECVAEDLNTLANDGGANRGIGVSPIDFCGAVEVVLRLKEFLYERYAIVAFFESSRYKTGLHDAGSRIAGNIFFRIAAEFAETNLIHEHCGRRVWPCEDLGHEYQHRLWCIRNSILYQTENPYPLEAEVLVLLGLPG